MTDDEHSPRRAQNPRRGRPIRRVDLDPGPIEPERVRGWFIAAGVAQPDAEGAARLASVFTSHKMAFVGALADAAYTEAALEASALAGRLLSLMPEMRRYHAPALAQGDPIGSAMARDLERLHHALQEASGTLQWVPVKPGAEIRDWRWLLGVIRPLLAPYLPPNAGVSKNGPLTRLLAEIIGNVAGNQVTPIAVWNQIGGI